MAIMNFAEFASHLPLEPGQRDSPDFANLWEAVSAPNVQSAAVTLLNRMSQVYQRIEQGGDAQDSDKAIARMIFMLAALQVITVGAIAGDRALIGRGTQFGLR